LCSERLRRNSIQLKIQHGSPNLKIECRSTEISQVLLNLLNNALDAVQPLDQKWISIDVADAGNDVEIAVTDSGPGIPAHLRDKIAQPFFTTKEIGKGTGLGLSISRGIAEAHHGGLFLDPVCANTRFIVCLPKRQPVPEPALAAQK